MSETPILIEYEASDIAAGVSRDGTAMLICVTDKGRIAIVTDRTELERLSHRIAHELEQTPAPSGRH